MFVNNKDCAIATAAGLTAGAWYILGNLAVIIITKQWISQELAQTLIPYISHLFLMVQPPFASFIGMTPEGFSILYFLIGLAQIFVVTALAVWVAAKIYRFLRRAEAQRTAPRQF